MDHEPDLVRVERRFEHRRSPTIIVAVLVTFVLTSLIKPWSLLEGPVASEPATVAPPSGSGLAIGGTPSPATSPTAAPTPAIVDPNAMACYTDAAEQVVVIDRWEGTEVRSWVAAKDSIVPGPLDPRLAPVPIFSTHAIGIGVCAPRASTGAQEPAAHLLEIAAIIRTDAGLDAIDLGEPVLITLQPTGTEPALLYGAPTLARPLASPVPSTLVLPTPGASTSPGASPGPSADATSSATPPPVEARPTWPTGSYSIAFRFASDSPNLVRWLRIDLIPGADVIN